MIVRRLDYIETEIKKLTEVLRLLMEQMMKTGAGNDVNECLDLMKTNSEIETYKEAIKKIIDCDENELQQFVADNTIYSETNIKLVAGILFSSTSFKDNKKALALYELLVRYSKGTIDMQVFNNIQLLQNKLKN